MKRIYYYKITRDCSDQDYEQIMEIRKGHFYEDSFDFRYWNGGIHNLLDIEQIKKSHNDDLNSWFLFILDFQDNLVAYSRFSTNITEDNNNFISKIHIIISKKEFIGKKIIINDLQVKLGDFILTKIIDFCSSKESNLIISEICIYPIPNIPSLILHKNKGFIPNKTGVNSIKRKDGFENIFSLFEKKIK